MRMHRLYYALAESLSGRALRAAGVATSMLGKGRERFDMEMRALRADTAEDLALLQNGVFAGNYGRTGAAELLRLGEALSETVTSSLGVAWLLRGKTLRVWGLFDRVRLLSTLTERLAHIVELLETATAGEAAPEFVAFRAAACRLPFPEEQLREDLQEGWKHGRGHCGRHTFPPPRCFLPKTERLRRRDPLPGFRRRRFFFFFLPLKRNPGNDILKTENCP